MPLRLYLLTSCPFCEKVRLSLKTMGLTWEEVAVSPDDRREIERVSGQRLVPVLCDDDRIVPDSTRILRYLVARYGERGLLPPGPADQAIAWIVEDYADEVLGPLIHSRLSGRSALGEPLDPRSRREVEKHLETQFRNLEQLLSERQTVLGGPPGLADVALYAFLSQLQKRGGQEISAGFPHLRAWYARMTEL
jgi:glutathione S-transferase